jgi:hypothetical protein
MASGPSPNQVGRTLRSVVARLLILTARRSWDREKGTSRTHSGGGNGQPPLADEPPRVFSGRPSTMPISAAWKSVPASCSASISAISRCVARACRLACVARLTTPRHHTDQLQHLSGRDPLDGKGKNQRFRLNPLTCLVRRAEQPHCGRAHWPAGFSERSHKFTVRVRLDPGKKFAAT